MKRLVLLALLAGCSPKEAPPLALEVAAPPPPAPAPAPAPAPVPAPLQTIRVVVGGDLLPHRPSLIAPKAIGDALAPLAKVFAGATAVVGNYEAATGEAPAGRMAYAAPPEWLGELAKVGFTAVSVANNHACDLGEPGVKATLAAASASKLVAAGGDDVDPWQPKVIAEASGKKVCALAWTTFLNADHACSRTRNLAVAPSNSDGKVLIDRAMARARASCDAVVAIVHGGQEYAPQTSAMMDQLAHVAEVGADAIVVHHPHVASPVVVLKTRTGRQVPVFASVGNLVTNQGESYKPSMFPVLRDNRHLVCVNAWTRLGVIADLSFDLDPVAPRMAWGEHLVWIENTHADDPQAEAKITTRLLDPTADAKLVAKLKEDAKGPLALFGDPCWIEGAHEGPRDPRCVVALPLPADRAIAPKRAASRRKK